MYYGNTFRLFYEIDLSMVLEDRLQKMKDDITGRSESYVLSVNETEFLSYLVDNYSIENLEVYFDDISVSKFEKSIPAEMFPGKGFIYNVVPGKSYKKLVVRYHIPFSGNAQLLKCKPSHWVMRTEDILINDNCVCFDIINFSNNPEKIQKRADEIISLLRSQLKNVRNQVDKFNSSLQDRAIDFFQNRKQHLLKTNDLLASLGVPIKKSDKVPSTFSIPKPKTRKKIKISPPEVHEMGFKPEPTLDSSTYQEILQIIQDFGKQFERMPSTYYDKDEESLRDHILLLLEPNFEGSATGETFNKSGKTDILLRYEGSNVFIAECKFWRGEKAYLESIDQLLGYLTWRDSKSSIVLFVKNKEFSSVIEKVELQTPNHPNYLGFLGKKDETWLNYRFHINDDPNREVKLTILLFHIPPN